MRASKILACAVFTVASSSFAVAASDQAPKYTAKVEHAFTPSDGVKRVAILPYKCPVQLTCAAFDRELASLIAAPTKLKVLGAESAREVMRSAKVDRIDYTTRSILAESLRVDAFAIIDVVEVSAQAVENPLAAFSPTTAKISKHVKLTVQLVSKDGTQLFSVSGEGYAVSPSSDVSAVALQTIKVALEDVSSK